MPFRAFGVVKTLREALVDGELPEGQEEGEYDDPEDAGEDEPYGPDEVPPFQSSGDEYRSPLGGDAYWEEAYESDFDEEAIAPRRDSPLREPESQEDVEEIERHSQDSAQFSEGTAGLLSQHQAGAVYRILNQFH